MDLGKGCWRVLVENKDAKLPIQLLLYHSECDRDSLEYVQAVNALLRANPESVAHLLVNESQSEKRMIQPH